MLRVWSLAFVHRMGKPLRGRIGRHGEGENRTWGGGGGGLSPTPSAARVWSGWIVGPAPNRWCHRWRQGEDCVRWPTHVFTVGTHPVALWHGAAQCPRGWKDAAPSHANGDPHDRGPGEVRNQAGDEGGSDAFWPPPAGLPSTRQHPSVRNLPGPPSPWFPVLRA